MPQGVRQTPSPLHFPIRGRYRRRYAAPFVSWVPTSVGKFPSKDKRERWGAAVPLNLVQLTPKTSPAHRHETGGVNTSQASIKPLLTPRHIPLGS